MYTIVLAIHLGLALVLVGVVLLQHGKGADAGAAFGSGASNTVFGARGSASFLGRLTGVLGVGFFATSLTLAIMAGTFSSGGSVVDGSAPEMPAVSEDAPAPADEGSGSNDDASAPAPAPD
ncbi:preprotein translocase subunit SecG [Spiribacter vilamensis]|uniref:Protein-export membrane protein SecG n=1 Tax=Spiribacter vilamensis TaxID=531306 RepID=A0A4Q8D0S7_9GAMM|nr:preprotein translocase subunit SecG [Spiribacter vilamensis]RZU98872.1 protein translocase subunit secG [Spiribacter vilamensis]TVO62112.1 preprotein translocase subunit SecG [Spiribacter vilamensis]